MINTFSPQELLNLPTPEIVDHLKSNTSARDGYSILSSIGADNLRQEMVVVGDLAQIALSIIFSETESSEARIAHLLKPSFPIEANRVCERTVALLSTAFPTTIRRADYRHEPRDKIGRVISYNHQSLFEVLAAIIFCLRYFPDKENLFPVNLPLFECLSRCARDLERLGIYILPLITPSTEDKFKELAIDRELVLALKSKFDLFYGDLSTKFLLGHNNDCLAPSSTRTPAIFPSKEAYQSGTDKGSGLPRTIGTKLTGLRKASREIDLPEIDFLTLTVVPRRRLTSRGLNILVRHNVYVDTIGDYPTMLQLHAQHESDYTVSRQFADNVPRYIRYPSNPEKAKKYFARNRPRI